MTTFVKQNMLGEYEQVLGGQSDPECTHVIMTCDEYSRLNQEYQLQIKNIRDEYEKELKQKNSEYDKLSAEYSELVIRWNDVEEKGEQRVVISQKEYNGYLNAKRIIKDRSLQLIEKSQKDTHGYRLIRAGKKNYGGKKGKTAYLIKKSTPYSIKMDLQLVNIEILDDLKKYYNYIGTRVFTDTKLRKDKRIDLSKYCDGIQQKDDPRYAGRDFFSSNDDEGRAIYRIFQEYKKGFIFEIDSISSNPVQGVYEVTYWATEMI